MNKCVFLDRDGVINKDTLHYIYKVEDFEILEGVIEALQKLKQAGYLLIIITNQAGIAKGFYQREDVLKCYEYLQSQCGGVIDDMYFSPHHPDYDTASLKRKPDSLMIEKAVAKYKIDVSSSWLVGDSEGDMVAGKKQHLKTIYLPKLSAKYDPTKKLNTHEADFLADNLWEATHIILKFFGV
jgi:D-glycero-D-manno-heptose 1,7-bisphosphate phosphatase